MLWALFYLLLALWMAAVYSAYLFDGYIHLLLLACTLIVVIKMFQDPRPFR